MPGRPINILTGKQFNRLTVRRLAPIRDFKGEVRWICDCECGTQGVIVRGTSLTSGNTKSCGCLQKERVQERWRKYREQKVVNDGSS